MKKEELENNKSLFTTEYDLETVFVEGFEVGNSGWVIDNNTYEVEDVEIVLVVKRSDDRQFYDEEDIFNRAPDNYDLSYEFVTDDDCYYVYFKYM